MVDSELRDVLSSPQRCVKPMEPREESPPWNTFTIQRYGSAQNGFKSLRPDLTGAGIGTRIGFPPVPVPVVPSYALDVALHKRLKTLMGLLDWEIDPDLERAAGVA